MAAEDQRVLSSSPIWRTAGTTTLQMAKSTVSSSPGLPSPSQILMDKIARPKIGCATVPIPNDPNTGSTSVSSLVQSGSLEAGIFPTPSDGKHIPEAKYVIENMDAVPQRVTEKGLKRRQETGGSGKAKGSHQTALRPKSKASADLAATQVKVNPIEEGSTSGSKSQNKPQKSHQSTIRKAKITKPGAGKTASKRSKKLDIIAAPEHQDRVRKEQESVEEDKNWQASRTEHGLGLAEALKRRNDWTPTKRIVDEADPPNETEAAWSALIRLESPSSGKPLDAGLGKLVGNFRYVDADKTSIDKKPASRSFNEECLTKRRKLDVSYLQSRNKSVSCISSWCFSLSPVLLRQSQRQSQRKGASHQRRSPRQLRKKQRRHSYLRDWRLPLSEPILPLLRVRDHNSLALSLQQKKGMQRMEKRSQLGDQGRP